MVYEDINIILGLRTNSTSDVCKLFFLSRHRHHPASWPPWYTSALPPNLIALIKLKFMKILKELSGFIKFQFIGNNDH